MKSKTKLSDKAAETEDESAVAAPLEAAVEVPPVVPASASLAERKFRQYTSTFSTTVSGGGVAPINAAIWSLLLEHQAEQGTRGHMLEIGVWYGHGTSMATMFRQPEERLLLLDKYMSREHSEPNILLADPTAAPAIDFRQGDSFTLRKTHAMGEYRDTVRWAHIDGEHSYEAVINDLDLVADLMCDGAIIAVDDFFNFSCPSCTEATFRWLSRNEEKFTLFMCGFNKAYLCSPRNLRPMLQRVHAMPGRLKELGFNVMACMSGWSAERPYFGLDYALPGMQFQQIGRARENATLSELFFDV